MPPGVTFQAEARARGLDAAMAVGSVVVKLPVPKRWKLAVLNWLVSKIRLEVRVNALTWGDSGGVTQGRWRDQGPPDFEFTDA